MSVKQCQREVDSAEFATWQAYSLLEPFGDIRADFRAGMVSATLANVHRGRQTPYAPHDFFPLLRPRRSMPQQQQTVAEQQYILGLVAEASRRSVA